MDVSLDLNKLSPNYGDLLLVDGDLVLTSDADARGTNNILQDILTRLRTFEGEWFLDNTIGTPWFQRILVKRPDIGLINGTLKAEILKTPGVFSLNKFQSTEDRVTRRLMVAFHCDTVAGRVAYNGNVLQGSSDLAAS